jgi:hypothetical protein
MASAIRGRIILAHHFPTAEEIHPLLNIAKLSTTVR